MSYLTIMHLGTMTRGLSKQERELKQYAETENLSWWSLKNKIKKKKK